MATKLEREVDVEGSVDMMICQGRESIVGDK